MEAFIKDGYLWVKAPLTTPRPSKSGKTFVVATSGGNKATKALVEGQPVVVGLNAYIKARGRLPVGPA